LQKRDVFELTFFLVFLYNLETLVLQAQKDEEDRKLHKELNDLRNIGVEDDWTDPSKPNTPNRSTELEQEIKKSRKAFFSSSIQHST
jgi:hypothetical protein